MNKHPLSFTIYNAIVLAGCTFLILFSTQLRAQYHIPVFPNLTGDFLLSKLLDDYKTSSVLDYGVARDLMYGTIYNINDSVSCVYSGHKLHLPQGVDPSSYLYMNGSPNGINAEHTYPRSKGADEDNGNAFSDMHHLFPTRAAVNSARSNFPFGEIIDNQTTTWYHLDQSQSNMSFRKAKWPFVGWAVANAFA